MAAYSYTLEILRDGTEPVGAPLRLPPPEPRLVEALRWRSFCAGQRLDPARTEVLPHWDPTAGRPTVGKLHATDHSAGRRLIVKAASFYATDVQRAAARHASAGLLDSNKPADWRIAAHPSPGADTAVDCLDPYPVADLDAPPPPNGTRTHDSDWSAQDDFEVRLPGSIVRQAIDLAASTPDHEIGGFLFGRLLRCTGRSPNPWLEITCLVPAEDGAAATASFRFTAQAWTRAQAHLDQRPAGEVFAGWMHSHPDLCNPQCSPDKRADCPLRKPFFSADDTLLHQSVFPAAWSVGLLVAHTGSTRVPALFGWRDGFVRRRSFQLIPD